MKFLREFFWVAVDEVQTGRRLGRYLDELADRLRRWPR